MCPPNASAMPATKARHKQTKAVETSVQEDVAPYGNPPPPPSEKPRFIDLFCGIGGFRIAFEKAGGRCVFSSDYDKFSSVVSNPERHVRDDRPTPPVRARHTSAGFGFSSLRKP